MCQKKTCSAERRTGCVVPSRCLQLSSNYLRQSFRKFKHDIEIWARNSSRLWPCSTRAWQSVLTRARFKGCIATGGRRWQSGDQPGGKFGQQARAAREAEVGVGKAGANQPVVELGRPPQSEEV